MEIYSGRLLLHGYTLWFSNRLGFFQRPINFLSSSGFVNSNAIALSLLCRTRVIMPDTILYLLTRI